MCVTSTTTHWHCAARLGGGWMDGRRFIFVNHPFYRPDSLRFTNTPATPQSVVINISSWGLFISKVHFHSLFYSSAADTQSSVVVVVFFICTLIKDVLQFLSFAFLSQLRPNALWTTSKLERPSEKLKTELTLPNCLTTWRHPTLFYLYFNFSHLLRVCAEVEAGRERRGGKGEWTEKHQRPPKLTDASKEEEKKKKKESRNDRLHICQNLSRGTSPSRLAWPSPKVQAVRFCPV